MPSKFVRAYQTSTGRVFTSLLDAQTDEIIDLMNIITKSEDIPPDKRAGVAMSLVDHKQEIIAILSQRERKHASPAVKVRKVKTVKLTETKA